MRNVRFPFAVSAPNLQAQPPGLVGKLLGRPAIQNQIATYALKQSTALYEPGLAALGATKLPIAFAREAGSVRRPVLAQPFIRQGEHTSSEPMCNTVDVHTVTELELQKRAFIGTRDDCRAFSCLHPV